MGTQLCDTFYQTPLYHYKIFHPKMVAIQFSTHGQVIAGYDCSLMFQPGAWDRSLEMYYNERKQNPGVHDNEK